jgi:hypothetical protein
MSISATSMLTSIRQAKAVVVGAEHAAARTMSLGTDGWKRVLAMRAHEEAGRVAGQLEGLVTAARAPGAHPRGTSDAVSAVRAAIDELGTVTRGIKVIPPNPPASSYPGFGGMSVSATEVLGSFRTADQHLLDALKALKGLA